LKFGHLKKLSLALPVRGYKRNFVDLAYGVMAYLEGKKYQIFNSKDPKVEEVVDSIKKLSWEWFFGNKLTILCIY